MKEVKPLKEIKYYSTCPSCHEKDGTVDHLLDLNTSTMWYCDNCGARYSLKFENGKMFIGKTKEYKEKTLVMLKYSDVVLIVEGMKFSDYKENNDAYFYNEGTCPINYMRSVKMIIDIKNNDNDPHGIFEYIETVDYDERIDDPNCTLDSIKEMFKIKKDLSRKADVGSVGVKLFH